MFGCAHCGDTCSLCCDRELFHLYQKKYREKVHSVSVSSSLKQELEVGVVLWREGRCVVEGS